MKQQLEARRTELQSEYAQGQQMLAQMEQERTRLLQTLLRIDGAIQLCNEILTQPETTEGEEAHGEHN